MSDVVLVLVVLAVVTAAAMAAAGRLGGLPPHEPADAGGWIASDPLTAAALAQVGFGLTWRGYRMSEVDAVLASAAARIAELEGKVDQ